MSKVVASFRSRARFCTAAAAAAADTGAAIISVAPAHFRASTFHHNVRVAAACFRSFASLARSSGDTAGDGAASVDGAAAPVQTVSWAPPFNADPELAKIGAQLGELDVEVKELKGHLRDAEKKPESARKDEEIRMLYARLHDLSQEKSDLRREKSFLLRRQLTSTPGTAIEIAAPDSVANSNFGTSDTRLIALLRLGAGRLKQGSAFEKPMLLTGEFFDQVVLLRDREMQVRQFLSLAWTRFSLKIFGDKIKNPILATQASPGMGKSSFIDLLCSLTFEQVRKLSPAEASDAFCRSFVGSQHVVVDYNGNQSVTSFDVDHPVAGLACRVLHSYFGHDCISYVAFTEKYLQKMVIDYRNLTLEHAIDVIACHRVDILKKPKGPVFIYIDEFRRLARTCVGARKELNQELEVLSAIGAALHSPDRPTVLISTLDHTPLLRLTSSSGRPIKYIALPPLSGPVVFADVPQYKSNPDVARLVSHLGGHPRNFAFLRSVLERADRPTYEMMFGLLYDHVVAKDETATDTPPELIADCLLGREVDYLQAVRANGKPYSYYVEQGRVLASCHADFLNGSRSSRVLIPRMSPFMLRVLLTMPKCPQFPHVVSKEVDEILHSMFRLGSVKAWPTFEQFHAIFECLRHTLYSTLLNQKTMSLGNLYPNALVGQEDPRDSSFLNRQLGHVVLAGAGNPGFDIAIPLSREECLLIEARFSNSNASTPIYIPKDTIAKRALVMKYIGKLKVAKPRKVILVLAALREKVAQSVSPSEIPPDTLVLNRQALISIYGPTLQAMAHFDDDEQSIASSSSTQTALLPHESKKAQKKSGSSATQTAASNAKKPQRARKTERMTTAIL